MGRKSYIAAPVQINHWTRCMTLLCIMAAIAPCLREVWNNDEGVITQSQKTSARNINENVLTGHFKEGEILIKWFQKVSRLYFVSLFARWIMGNLCQWWLEECVKCSSECRERLDYFHSEKMTLFSPLWQTSLIDLPAPLSHPANQWLATFMWETLPDTASTKGKREGEGERQRKPFLFHSCDWHVFRREQLEVQICQRWSTLSSGRISWGSEQLEVQLRWMSSLWHCRLWQASCSTTDRGEFMEMEAECWDGWELIIVCPMQQSGEILQGWI